MTNAVILANGLFPTEPYPLYLLEHADVMVCCDGAFEKYLDRYGTSRLPEAVIGDMDSLSPELRERYAHLIVKVDEQDHNDQTKAMRYILSQYPDVEEICILGATGLREDHTIGNLGLLMEYTRMFNLGQRKVMAVSDFGTSFAITDSCDLHLGEGRRISIFSADNSLRITSEGLQWPLDNVVFDAWWKATLNRTTAPIVSLHFSHPSAALVMVD